MANNYTDKLLSIIQAEKTLSTKEALLMSGKKLIDGVKVFSTALCGVTIYKVTAKGGYHHATTTLISTYAVLNKQARCQEPPSLVSNRLSWRMVPR